MTTTTDAAPRRYRIAEMARLTGFTPTTLRFYEQAGVLSAPERTPAGYRVYGDRDVERLGLIARAKDLGCTLEEIAGLVAAWDADECAPVKHQLRSLVNAKVADVQRHIEDQVALAAQLRATAAGLATRPVDGPCADGCGCTTPVPEALTIACSLGGGDRATRAREWRTLLDAATERHRLPHGVRVVFGATAPLAEIARLAGAEHDCCPFLAFAITVDGRGVALEVTAPADGQVLLESVFGTAP
jgi:DNA-binding transcriptional MerR regulator